MDKHSFEMHILNMFSNIAFVTADLAADFTNVSFGPGLGKLLCVVIQSSGRVSICHIAISQFESRVVSADNFNWVKLFD